MLQNVKDYLVSLGPDSVAVRLALRLHARRHGFRMEFNDSTIVGNLLFITSMGKSRP
jgi:hypothetical protein